METIDRNIEASEFGQPVWIIIHILAHPAQYLRGYPAGAGFEARKFGFIQNDAAEIVLLQQPGTGRPGRSATNNKYIRFYHDPASFDFRKENHHAVKSQKFQGNLL